MRLFACACALLLAGCAATNRVYVAPALRDAASAADTLQVDSARAAEETYRVLLVGDVGAPRTDGPDPLLETLRRHALAAGPRSLTVFLGDNIYDDGLPPADDPRRPEAEARLQAQLDAVAGVPGRALFIPGNHDWKHSAPGGLAQLLEQERFVEAALGPGSFLPSNGYPGPVAVDLTDDLRLLVIDTEWWLGRYARGEGDDAEAGAYFGDDQDFLLALHEAVQEAGDRQLLVVGHHPLRSNGDHAGAMPPERHLFPLRGKFDGPLGYVPLPLLGSLTIAIKRAQGEDAQDLGHPRNRALRAALFDILAQHEAPVYAAGHDHSLQYLPLSAGRNTVHQLVSGAGSEAEYAGTEDAAFVASRRGFFVLTYYGDGSARLTALAAAEGRPLGDTLLAVRLLEPTLTFPAPPAGTDGPAPPRPDSAAAAADPRYARAGFLTRALVGSGYRATWARPVTAPVLDFGREGGGLTPVRINPGNQSLSLRLEGADGRTYALRSLAKGSEDPLGLGFTTGAAHDAAQDATAGLYPYGAVVAASLSDAAGLYHTNPRLFYVPDDPRLGPLRERFAGHVMILEEVPSGSGEGIAHYGNAEALLSPARLQRALDGDADHRVDAPFYLRTRLLDVLLGDWDRHPGQWRWAAFEPGALDPALTGDAATDGKVYRPVARDRDWALNDRDGLLFDLARRFLPKIQGLQPHYLNIGGLTTSARAQDRRFLAPLDRAAWRREAQALQAAMTDEALAAAVGALPAEARAHDGAHLLERLTARRDRLLEAAMDFYDVLSGVVDVVGSHDREAYALAWEDGGRLRVTVREREDDGAAGALLWTRTFDPAETREVRLWARGGDDRIELTGRRGRSPLFLRLLPGAGEDVVADRTDGAGVSVYEGAGDTGLTVEALGDGADLDRTNRVPTAAFGYTPPVSVRRRPLLVFDYTGGDGLILGGGFAVTDPGFFRATFLRQHRFTVAVATATGGVRVRYRGAYPDALGRLDLGLRAEAQTPFAGRNFFGYGTGPLPAAAAADFYRVPLAEARLEPYAERRLPGEIRLWAGPTLTYARPDVDGRYAAVAGLPARDLRAQVFGGATAGVEIDAVDDAARPRQGARYDASLRGRLGLRDAGHAYAVLASSLTLYETHPALPGATLAFRMGGAHRWGTFPFYDAATLGGGATLRGYRSQRFTGRSVLYVNVEPRLSLGRLLSAEVGVLGFYDLGRLWADGAGGAWRAGYGAGLWAALGGPATGVVAYERSAERRAVTLRLGFAL